jgi:hypothetical protein
LEQRDLVVGRAEALWEHEMVQPGTR